MDKEYSFWKKSEKLITRLNNDISLCKLIMDSPIEVLDHAFQVYRDQFLTDYKNGVKVSKN
jgi:hypothetical protein